MEILRVLFALLVAAACSAGEDHRSQGSALAQHSASPRDSALFARLLDSVPAEGAPLLAVRSFLTDRNGWLAGDSILRWVTTNLEGVRPETMTAFRVAMTDSGGADSLFGTHRGVIWISQDSGGLVTPGGDNSGILHVSRPAYSADSAQAMLYAVFRCGAHCGPAEYVLFERGPSALSWRMRARLSR